MGILSKVSRLRRIDPLDWLYPPSCHFCTCALKSGRSVCADCSGKLPRIEFPFCDVCGESFPGDIDASFACPNCTGLSFHFEFARAAMDRSDEMLELVHRLKYNREIHLARDLGVLTCEAFSDRRLKVAKDENWILVPVPLHRSRHRERYFNQAEEISKVIGKESDLRIGNFLKRIRKTQTQTRLSRNQRMENLKGAFAIKGGEKLLKDAAGVILVDDVFTTGSTVDACAKVLRSAGVPRVVVLTVMRG
ncbi:ComF family protein [Luteolibacter sp. AS25]|uniref:ComF family protein n=1 Tax=Luteolibacter sp. AS25 TaxID=3135776 RepID=UPI00398B521D